MLPLCQHPGHWHFTDTFTARAKSASSAHYIFFLFLQVSEAGLSQHICQCPVTPNPSFFSQRGAGEASPPPAVCACPQKGARPLLSSCPTRPQSRGTATAWLRAARLALQPRHMRMGILLCQHLSHCWSRHRFLS